MFELIVSSVTIIGNILLALFAYFNNRKSATNILFTIIAIAFSGVALGTFLATRTHDPNAAIFWVRVNMFFAAIVTSSLFPFLYTYPSERNTIPKRLLISIILWTAVLCFLCFTPLIFKEARFDPNLNTIPGPGIVLFGLTLFANMGFGFFFLVRKYRRSNGLVKAQIQFLGLGLLASFGVLTSLNFLAVVLLKNTSFVNIGISSIIIFIAATAYAIVRHRLLAIRLIVARTVAYALLATVLFSVYVFATIIATSFFLKTAISFQQIALFGTLTLVAGYSFQPLRAVFENLTDKVFYKGLYDSQDLLSRLSNIMATTLGIKPLIAGTLNRLVVEMRITRGAIVVFEGNKIMMQQAYSYDKEPKFSYSELTELHDGKIIILDELEEGPVKNLMRKLNISVAVPLEAGKEMLGFLLLGEKASGEIYTGQDIDVLEVFSPELAIAIENGKSYEEIKRFNITLEEKIKKATVDLTAANNRLKDLDKAKDEFVSVVSHELRTPMTAVKSYIWLVLNGKAGALTPKTQEYLSKVYQSSERLIGMINDVLEVSHIETGRFNIDLQPVSLLKSTQEVFDNLAAKAAEQKINLVVDKNATVPLVSADVQKLSEVFTNLIGNALKFTKAGGSITVSFQKNSSMIETSVTDTGVGMNKDDLTKLFAKFGRLESSYATMASTGGSGLGLYITKSYIELMHGKIWVNSTLGKGTTFTFSLPISQNQTLPKESSFLVSSGIIKTQ